MESKTTLFSFLNLFQSDTPQVFISLQKVESNLIEASINIENTSEVLGTSFHLEYDPSLIKYDSFQKGDFFEQGLNAPVYLVKEKEGKIIIGVSLKKGDNLVQHSGTILKLYFKPLKDSAISLKFDKSVLSSLQSGTRQDIPTSWQPKDFTMNNLTGINIQQSVILALLTVFAIILAIWYIRSLAKSEKMY